MLDKVLNTSLRIFKPFLEMSEFTLNEIKFNLFIFLSVVEATILGIIHLVRTQDFPENFCFLPPDMHTYVCVSGGKKC